MELFREALLRQRSEILFSLGPRFAVLARSTGVAEDEQAQVCHDEFLTVRLRGLAFDKLRQVDAALRRLEDGSYGVCEECEDLVPVKRLLAVPWTRYCIGCQEKVAARQKEAENWPDLLEWPPAA